MARVRSRFEQTSADRALQKSEKSAKLKSRINEKGIKRVRFSRGWISAKTADSREIHTERGPCPQADHKSRLTGRTYFVNHTTGQSTFDRSDPMIARTLLCQLRRRSSGGSCGNTNAPPSPSSTAYMSSTQQRRGICRFLPLSAGDGYRTQHHATEEHRYVEPNFYATAQPVKTVRTQKIVVGERQRPCDQLAWTRCVLAARVLVRP